MKTFLLVCYLFINHLTNGQIFLDDVDEPIQIVDLTAVSGYKAQISCDVTPLVKNETAIMVFWYKNEDDGRPIYRFNARGRSLSKAEHWADQNTFQDRAKMKINGNLVQLEIAPLEPRDYGVYKCRVDFRNSPTRNQKFNLTVIELPKQPMIYTGLERNLAKMIETVNEGSQLYLTCEVLGGNPLPNVTWYLDGKLLDDTYRIERDDITVNHLDVPKVTRDFLNARLICAANNTKLVAPVTADILLNVNLKPLNVNITNKKDHVSALRTYEVECISFGSRPEAIITWWKGTHQVKHMARNFADSANMTKSILSYVPTIEDDGKFLTCRAENSVVPDSACEDRWKLIVHYVPVVTIKLGSTLRADNINEGDDVYFECHIRSMPKAYKLSWFKDGKELHQNTTAGIILPGGQSLVLQNVNRNSAGEYSCMAVNTEGKATSRPVTLDVLYKPICKDGITTQVVGALKHETISLVCGVQSKPPPTSFQWTFNNSGEMTSVPANRFTQVKPQRLITNHWHGSRLNYTPANDMDYGTVSCLAQNRIGKQKIPCVFQIIVAGKPYPLQNCSALQSTGPYAHRMGHEDFKKTDSRDADWLIVKCNEGFDGGLPLTSFELEVYSEENVYHANTIYLNHTDRSSGPIFEVPGLEPGRNYKLLLYAVNAKGRSDPVILEPVTLKGVAMYTTGRGSSSESSDYSLLVACFAGGITAVCILIVGVTVTLYRRNNPLPSRKIQTHIVEFDSNRRDHHHHHHVTPLTPNKSFCESKEQILTATTGSEDNPDIIPNKVDIRRPDVFEPNFASIGTTTTPMTVTMTMTTTSASYQQIQAKDFRCLENIDYPSPSSVLHGKDSWVFANGYTERTEKLSPIRPSTLPVHRTQDIYTRSSRVQESCI